jgi:hypothetical protein
MVPRMWQRAVNGIARIAIDEIARRSSGRADAGRTATPPASGPAPVPSAAPGQRAPYPGDFTGAPPWEYEPRGDGLPDPGEVVWAWVPYEEDHARGKDRPALVIGRDGPWLLAMPMTSKDHDRDAAQEAAAGRYWVDVGSGPWDSSQRESEARVDRVVRLDPAGVRREGAALPRDRFDEVIRARASAHESAQR